MRESDTWAASASQESERVVFSSLLQCPALDTHPASPSDSHMPALVSCDAVELSLRAVVPTFACHVPPPSRMPMQLFASPSRISTDVQCGTIIGMSTKSGYSTTRRIRSTDAGTGATSKSARDRAEDAWQEVGCQVTCPILLRVCYAMPGTWILPFYATPGTDLAFGTPALYVVPDTEPARGATRVVWTPQSQAMRRRRRSVCTQRHHRLETTARVQFTWGKCFARI